MEVSAFRDMNQRKSFLEKYERCVIISEYKIKSERIQQIVVVVVLGLTAV